MMIMMRHISNKREHAERTPVEVIPRVIFAAEQDLPEDPVEERKAMKVAPHHDQRNGSRQLNIITFTRLAKM